jgi:branched-chain amino acid transport system ATP-binding protein
MSRLLTLEGVASGYGDVPVLDDVALHVDAGEVVAVVGANGAGKTTLLSTICGLVRRTAGTIRFDDADIGDLPAHTVVERGLAMVPEGGRLFPFMTVQENLELGAFAKPARAAARESMAEVLELFPILAERRQQLAGSLSGGERQMCAIARAVMRQPRMLMLDEPSLGLSPLMVEKVFELIVTLVRRKSLTVLLVEQNVGDALQMAARGYVVEHGRVVRTGSGRELLEDAAVRRAYLGLD